MNNIIFFIKSIFSQSSGSANTIDYDSYIMDRITIMRESQNLTFEEITDTFNNEDLKVISGRGEWTVKKVEKIYKRDSMKKLRGLKKGK